jgi:hypothetical protein
MERRLSYNRLLLLCGGSGGGLGGVVGPPNLQEALGALRAHFFYLKGF